MRYFMEVLGTAPVLRKRSGAAQEPRIASWNFQILKSTAAARKEREPYGHKANHAQ